MAQNKVRWTEYEENFLIENYTNLSVQKIAKALCKTELSVRHKAFRLSLIKGNVECNEYPSLIPNEIWKDVKGYEGLYLVSSIGRIWGFGRNFHRSRMLKPQMLPSGYMIVNLYDKDRKMKTQYVHRIVASAFIENPNHYKDINHKDEVRSNNKASNLEWCSRSYNNNYGTRSLKVSKPVKMLSLDGKVIRYFIGAKAASKETGIPHPNIRKCCRKTFARKNNGICYPYLTAGGYRWEYATKEEYDGMMESIKRTISNE